MRLKQVEAVRVFAGGRAMVYLNAVVTRGPDDEVGEIVIEEPWRKTATKYHVAVIEWIEYATRGTPGEYTENRRSKL